MKKIFKWIIKHVRPTVKMKKPLVGRDEELNVDTIKENIKDGAEVGIKIKFKF